MKPSKHNKERKEKKACECAQLPYCPGNWIRTECPFAVAQQRAVQRPEQPMNFYKTLVCSCGKQVGEVQFSGYEAGKWRIFEDKLTSEEKLSRFRDFMLTDIFKEIQSMLQTMGRLEQTVSLASISFEKIV